MKRRTSPCLPKVIPLLLLILALSGCALMNPYGDEHEKFEKSIKLFNLEFDIQRGNRGSLFVHPEERGRFLLNIQAFDEKLTIYQSSILDIKFLKDDKAIKLTSSGPEERFNKAVVLIRYQFALLPSNRVKTIIIEQEWFMEGNSWFVKPDLTPFIK